MARVDLQRFLETFDGSLVIQVADAIASLDKLRLPLLV